MTKVFMPAKLVPVAQNVLSEIYSKVILYGGRGSGKSQALAVYGIMESYKNDGVILCAREIQKSINDSIYASIVSCIESMGVLGDFYITKTTITNLQTGAVFLFSGLKTNITAIKSINKLRVALVDEAENVSENSWNILMPTLRYLDTRVYIVFNPRFEKDPTYKMFVKDADSDTLCIKINYNDNVMFPASLEKQRLAMYAKAERTGDFNLYNWVWNGDFMKVANASILGNLLQVEHFEVDDSFGRPYIGIDWGFSIDPNVIVECYVKGRNLYVNRVGMAHKLPLNRTAAWLKDQVPLVESWPSWADCARPETVNQMNLDGLTKVKSCTKTKINDGVAVLQSFDKIIINTTAGKTRDVQEMAVSELAGYSYKTLNKDTPQEVVTPDIVDASNNVADAIRYALQDLIIKEIKQPFFIG